MKASRELDALVAERVMRLEVVIEEPNDYFDGFFVQTSKPRVVNHLSGSYHDRGLTKLPHYSTDIGAAWQIVATFDRVSITKLDMPDRFQVTLVFHTGMGDFAEFKAEAPTAPLAICLAALKAVEE